MLIYFFVSYNLPAPVINEANKYIMHTCLGAKLFIGKLDYCLKVDEPNPNAKKNGMCVRTCSTCSVKCEVSHKNIVKVDFLMLIAFKPSNRESWHL